MPRLINKRPPSSIVIFPFELTPLISISMNQTNRYVYLKVHLPHLLLKRKRADEDEQLNSTTSSNTPAPLKSSASVEALNKEKDRKSPVIKEQTTPDILEKDCKSQNQGASRTRPGDKLESQVAKDASKSAVNQSVDKSESQASKANQPTNKGEVQVTRAISSSAAIKAGSKSEDQAATETVAKSPNNKIAEVTNDMTKSTTNPSLNKRVVEESKDVNKSTANSTANKSFSEIAKVAKDVNQSVTGLSVNQSVTDAAKQSGIKGIAVVPKEVAQSGSNQPGNKSETEPIKHDRIPKIVKEDLASVSDCRYISHHALKPQIDAAAVVQDSKAEYKFIDEEHKEVVLEYPGDGCSER